MATRDERVQEPSAQPTWNQIIILAVDYVIYLSFSIPRRLLNLPSKPIIAKDRIKYKVCYPIR